ncbi:MAG: HD domain-containing protein [Myxococcales bacterium]|nr:HD domain-containing protein [Myxococcales bacterium]
MILRDPVHGLVAFEGRSEQVVTRLLATREVQRLRDVRQLGFTSLVFPGAEHSRFAHSLGAAHVLNRMMGRLRSVEGLLPLEQRLDDEAEADALAAALLHDIGHGPFSHLFEEVLPGARHHEAWTLQILRDPGTDVHRALRALSLGMPERVADLLEGSHRLPYLARCISGRLDADRADYLLRDSHMTGVSYGVYDLDWLLQALTFGELEGGRWVVAIEGRKGLPPIEGFFLARQFMYQQVYHHKATRAAELLIRGIFERVAELVREGRPAPDTPAMLVCAAHGQVAELGDYLDLDDAVLLAAFRRWARGSDPVLAELTRALLRRELPKTLPLPADPSTWDEATERARQVVSQGGRRADLWVRLDVAADTPFQEDPADAEGGLWVSIRHQPIQRLGECSFLLGQLRNQRIERPRLIFPAEQRDRVIAAVAGLIAEA